MIASAAAAVSFAEYLASQAKISVAYCGGEVGIGQFEYTGNASGFMSGSYGPMPAYCEVGAVAAGSDLTLALFLHSSDTGSPHTIESIVAEPPFRLVGLAPAVPATIPPGGNASFQGTLQAPASSGSYYPSVDVALS